MGEKTAIIAAIAASAIVLLAATPAAAQSARQSGNVFDEQGNPIAGAEVKFDRVKASSSRDHQITKTDAKGSFVITGIRGGSWNVTITAPGYEVYQSTVQVSSFSKNLALNIKLKKLDPSAVGGGAREEAEALVAQADSLIEEGKFNEAIALYQDYLAKNPQLVTINLMIGKAFEKMMDYDSAIAAYAKVLESNPDDYNALLLTGTALIRKMEYGEAEKYFVRLAEIRGDDPNIMYTLGEIMLDGGQTTKAIEYYSKAVELNPDFADAHMKLGYACYGEQRWADAIVHFEKFIELAPDRPETQFVRSDLELCKAKLKEK